MHPHLLIDVTIVFADTVGYLSFHPMAQCVVHAVTGLACRGRVQLTCLALQAVLSAHVACTPRKIHNIFSMGPKLRYPGGVCADG